MGTESETPGPHPLLARRYKCWLLAVLLLVSTLNFADRAVLSVLAQPIKEDLKLSDADLGMLQGLGFAILYSLLGVPLGWLSERVSRKGLISVCVAVWSLMSAGCGLATGFFTMLLGRVGVGIGEAGFLPPMSSLLADHFRAERRASVMAIMALGAPFGFLLGQSAGGWLAAEWSWRVAFFVFGAPGLLAALIVALTLREPPRGLADGLDPAQPPASLMRVAQYLWSKPSFRHLIIAYALASFTLNAVAQFVLPFYLRGFALPLALVGAVFGIVAFSSNGAGMLLGGFGFDRLSRHDVRWSLWGPAAALALSAPLYVLAFASPDARISMTLVGAANLILVTHVAPTAATVQNLVGPQMRAFSAALLYLAAGLIGAGLGPTVLGIASDFFAAETFGGPNFLVSCPGGRAAPGGLSALDPACRAASTQGLREALMCVQAVLLWGAVHYLLAARTLKRDLYKATSAPREAA